MVAGLSAELEQDPNGRRTSRKLALAPAPASASPVPFARYAAEPNRCVVEAVLRLHGCALWRVRLRTIAVDLNLPLADLPTGDASYGSLTAQLPVRPRFASLPGTLGLFLPDVPRDRRITLTATAIASPLIVGETVTSPAKIEIDEQVRDVEIAVETILNDGDRVIVAITGAIPRSVPIPFPGCALHIDAAIEFRQWA